MILKYRLVAPPTIQGVAVARVAFSLLHADDQPVREERWPAAGHQD